MKIAIILSQYIFMLISNALRLAVLSYRPFSFLYFYKTYFKVF